MMNIDSFEKYMMMISVYACGQIFVGNKSLPTVSVPFVGV